MSDTEGELYWSLRIHFCQSGIVVRLIFLCCQVSFTVAPRLTCRICLETVNIKLHTLLHQSNNHSPRQAREAGDLSHHGGILTQFGTRAGFLDEAAALRPRS